jgi:PAS domain S-box-containing protein
LINCSNACQKTLEIPDAAPQQEHCRIVHEDISPVVRWITFAFLPRRGVGCTFNPRIAGKEDFMERLSTSGSGVSFPEIGATLPNVSARSSTFPDREKAVPTPLRLDAAFVTALYNGLTEAILGVEFGTRKIVHWNKGAEAMFGYPAHEVLGQTTEIIYPDQHSFDQISELAAPKIRESGAWKSEWEYRRRDGSRFFADVVATTIESEEGAEFYVIVIRDISARKEADAEFERQRALLLKIRQRLQAVLDNTPMLIYVVGTDGKLGLINRRFEELFSVDAKTIAGTPLSSVFDGPTAKILLDNNHNVLGSQATIQFEEMIPQADGLHTYISVKVPLCDEAGVFYAVCAISTDITERKRDQELIRKMNVELERRVIERTAELENANEQLREEIINRRQAERKLFQRERMAAIGVTTSKLIHEIANPVQTMITAVEVLQRETSRAELPSIESLHLLVTMLKNELDLLMNLLAELKDVASPRVLEIRPVDLTALIRELLAFETLHYNQLGVCVEENLPSGLPPVPVDAMRMKQVLLNLFKNAVEAMPGGGRLRLNAYHEGGQLVLEIADTGTGIPEGINVFEMFISNKPIGAGLGLAIVKDIVSAHQGTISYTSEVGRGTTFELRLPVTTGID